MYTALRQMVQIGIETWGVRQFATQVDVAPELLAAGSAADFAGWDTAMVGRVARMVGVDPGLAYSDEPVPSFRLLAFLRDAWGGGLDADDAVTLRRALRVAAGLRAEGLRAQHRYQPRTAGGKDVWQAGYSMARRVRRDLGVLDAPILNLRGLAEASLGILVVCVPLQTPRMEALAVANAAGAAIVLNRSLNLPATHLRRSVAHELCHLLFDPHTSDGLVDVITSAIEDDAVPEGQRMSRERRAKAFAAEFLVPEAGLKIRFSGCTHRLEEARERVRAVSETFGAPWQLVVWHLHNHAIIGASARDVLLGESPDDLSGPGLGEPAARDWLVGRLEEGEISEGWIRGFYGPEWYSELGAP